MITIQPSKDSNGKIAEIDFTNDGIAIKYSETLQNHELIQVTNLDELIKKINYITKLNIKNEKKDPDDEIDSIEELGRNNRIKKHI